MHKILAARLRNRCRLNEAQRAFTPVDGVADNTIVLDTILHSARSNLKELHIATLDITKAFDGISHHAILEAAKRVGCPSSFLNYIKNIYDGAHTNIGDVVNDRHKITLRRGVRQGDPMSPILFNMVMDWVICSLPQDIGYRLSGETVSCLAFADDLLLMSSTVYGMKTLLRRITELLAEVGLRLSSKKCSVLSFVPSGREKKYKVIEDSLFELEGAPLKQITAVDTWRYLGITYSPLGRKAAKNTLGLLLKRLSKAPLKPQQRLYILRFFVIPRFVHGLILGKTTARSLKEMDLTIRKFVRRTLHLPKDLALGAFYAPVKEGGMGIMSFQRHVPALVIRRFTRLETSSSTAARAAARSTHVNCTLAWAKRVLQTWSYDTTTTDQVKKEWSRRLHEAIDGKDLKDCAKVAASSDWTRTTRADEYVKFHQLRLGALPTRVRTSRGERRAGMDVNCRAGCNSTETATHVIQQCHRTHGGRIRRHDAVVNIIANHMKSHGWKVQCEKVYRTPTGVFKPDIVAGQSGRATVIDVQVRSGSMEKCHIDKRDKYAKNRALLRMVSDELGVNSDAIVTTVTLSYKGVWSLDSAEDLKALGFTRGLLGAVTRRVLQGSYKCWTRFNQLTTVVRPPGVNSSL